MWKSHTREGLSAERRKAAISSPRTFKNLRMNGRAPRGAPPTHAPSSWWRHQPARQPSHQIRLPDVDNQLFLVTPKSIRCPYVLRRNANTGRDSRCPNDGDREREKRRQIYERNERIEESDVSVSACDVTIIVNNSCPFIEPDTIPRFFRSTSVFCFYLLFLS